MGWGGVERKHTKKKRKKRTHMVGYGGILNLRSGFSRRGKKKKGGFKKESCLPTKTESSGKADKTAKKMGGPNPRSPRGKRGKSGIGKYIYGRREEDR